MDSWRGYVEHEVGLHGVEGLAEVVVHPVGGKVVVVYGALAIGREGLDAGDHLDARLLLALTEPIAAPAAQPYEYGFHWRPFSVSLNKGLGLRPGQSPKKIDTVEAQGYL